MHKHILYILILLLIVLSGWLISLSFFKDNEFSTLKKIDDSLSIVSDKSGNIYFRLSNPEPDQCGGELHFDADEGNYPKPGEKYLGEVLHLRDIIDLPSLHLVHVDKFKPLIVLEDKGFQYNINVMYCSFTFYLKKKQRSYTTHALKLK